MGDSLHERLRSSADVTAGYTLALLNGGVAGRGSSVRGVSKSGAASLGLRASFTRLAAKGWTELSFPTVSRWSILISGISPVGGPPSSLSSSLERRQTRRQRRMLKAPHVSMSAFDPFLPFSRLIILAHCRHAERRRWPSSEPRRLRYSGSRNSAVRLMRPLLRIQCAGS